MKSLDLSMQEPLGSSLCAVLPGPNQDHKPSYQKGWVWNQKPPPTIKLRASFNHNLNLQHFSGLTFLESWDWTSVDSECIMSREKLWSSIFEINIIYIYIHLTGCANIRLEMENSRCSVILLYRRVATANTLLTVNANQTWSKPFRPWMHLPIQNNSIYTLHPTCPRDERQINDARGMLVGASSVSQFNISCSKVWIEPLQMMPMSRPASWLGTTHLKPSSNK